MVPLGFLLSGEVVVDRHRSHLHSTATLLLPAALQEVSSSGRAFLKETVDFGRSVGETSCVRTGQNDTIVYAQRSGRAGLTRFVKNREAEPCSSMVVILKAGDDNQYILISALVGFGAEPEPWDRNATPQSVAYWSERALVWGSEDALCHECGELLSSDSQEVAFVGQLAFCAPCVADNQSLNYSWGTVLTETNFPGWGPLTVPV